LAFWDKISNTEQKIDLIVIDVVAVKLGDNKVEKGVYMMGVYFDKSWFFTLDDEISPENQ